ncbi:unnamed protein product [Spirodela intermedia]|uniref:Uncharacterized protein n=1 Tax=Spirodela intermedia TaxID=51605 RepID=A0A7I8ITX8_SPIIN|nr:unnamed protein product [Spirodela intermedia]CAA6661079.1 unnamed protein product [Spirodela intermedia]
MGKEGRFPSSDVCRQLSAILVLLPLVSGKTFLHVLDTNISVSAVFTFGDSTVDSGNNNYIPTATKSNFPPYGRDFPGHQPTGRFCNGRIGADFIAADLGVKDEVPPYLDRSLSVEELTTGVCFGSAGTGFDPLTAKMSAVIPMRQQLNYFREYLARIELAVGRKLKDDIMERAIFVVSAGTNDFITNYNTYPFRRHEFSVEEYGSFLRQRLWEFLEGLAELGARKIGILSLPPMGCLPIVISVNSMGEIFDRRCVVELNAMSRDYNAKLRMELESRPISPAIANVSYVDIYSPMEQLIRRPAEFGLEETTTGCCGTGLVELGFLCNPKSVTCPDASKYLFWDAVHPTEKAYALIIDALRPAIAHIIRA